MRRRTLITAAAGIAATPAIGHVVAGGGATLTITGTNAPVGGGAFLHVDVTVDNPTGSAISDTITLSDSSGTTVDTRSASVAAGATRTYNMGFETYETKQDVTFPITAETSAASDSVDVTVTAIGEDAGLSVAVEQALDEVTGGEYLEVQFSLGNEEPRDVTDTVHLTDSKDVVLDSAEYTVHGSSTKYAALGYETYPVKNDVSFPISVASSVDSDSREVTVYGTG